jgi:hypothetical protein
MNKRTKGNIMGSLVCLGFLCVACLVFPPVVLALPFIGWAWIANRLGLAGEL